jgi:hypothetical protein
MRPMREGSPNSWRAAGILVFLMGGALGCPHTFGRSGTLDRAAHKDAIEGIRSQDDCPLEDVEQFCAESPDPEDCLRKCGE